jgi:hypothetical protein
MSTWPDDFKARVDFAASVVSKGGSTSRRFDSTCEMNDGDAVVVALFRRVQARPDTALARNIWRYLHKETVQHAARILYLDDDLEDVARQMRAGTWWKIQVTGSPMTPTSPA